LARKQSTSKTRVLYVITRAEHGGAQSHILELLRASVGRYNVALATGESGFLTNEARILGIPVFLLTQLVVPLNPLKDLCALAQLSKVIREFQPSLIHAHSSKAGLLARIAARFHRVPCVFTAHGWAFSEGVSQLRKWIAMPLEWLAGRLGANIIVVSKFDYDLALHYGVADTSHMSAIANGIPDCLLRAHPERGGPPVIAMVARFNAQKDHRTLLRALSQVQAPFRLLLIGDGPLLEQSRAFVGQLGLTSRTEFLGDCASVRELLANTHLFALISRYEGLPISILEAMCAGLPIIATDTGGVSEAVRQGWNGLLVGRTNERTLRDALESLLDDPGLRASFGRHSRALFEKSFTVETMIGRTFEVYDHTLTSIYAHKPSPGYANSKLSQPSI
jgi:glycosyltransferase involved in cell wall biosynthesis